MKLVFLSKMGAVAIFWNASTSMVAATLRALCRLGLLGMLWLLPFVDLFRFAVLGSVAGWLSLRARLCPSVSRQLAFPFWRVCLGTLFSSPAERAWLSLRLSGRAAPAHTPKPRVPESETKRLF